jgi:hypothetical protein
MASVFISYSHKDEEWKDKLAVQVGVLAAENRLEVWEDRQIEVGDDWLPEIEKALDAAKVAVLLISAPFLTSNFIRRNEVPAILARRQNEGLRVVPILVHPCPWRKVEWLTKMQMLPRDGREVAGGTPYQIDKDFAGIAEKIDDLIGAASPPASVARTASSRFDLSALPPTGQYFFGRDDELAALDKSLGDAVDQYPEPRCLGRRGQVGPRQSMAW